MLGIGCLDAGLEVTMSDFQDFLKRQYAHVAIGEFKPGKFAEAQKLYEQAVATYQHGFKGAYLLREPSSDRGISIIFWENLEDMGDGQAEAHHQDILKQMAPLFTQTPNVGVYELVTGLEPTTQVLESL
jgi:heme-degrading monooxygenase HmoA